MKWAHLAKCINSELRVIYGTIFWRLERDTVLWYLVVPIGSIPGCYWRVNTTSSTIHRVSWWLSRQAMEGWWILPQNVQKRRIGLSCTWTSGWLWMDLGCRKTRYWLVVVVLPRLVSDRLYGGYWANNMVCRNCRSRKYGSCKRGSSKVKFACYSGSNTASSSWSMASSSTNF